MYPYVVVDAFAPEPLMGNPVAVFFDCDDLTPELMQGIAWEMNLSETTFVLRPEQDGDFHVRIFTPVNELPFAGHPLLGTAVAIGARTGMDAVRMETAQGTVPFVMEYTDGKVTGAKMCQPVPVWEPFDRSAELLAALGVDESTLPVEIYRNGPRHVLVGIESFEALSKLEPDHRALSRFPDMAVNCFAGSGLRWRNRMFSPAYGVVEDAATGSAAGPIAIHLARHGLAPWGQRIEITQGIELGRPSPMRVKANGEGDRAHSVALCGDGVITLQGTLNVGTPRRAA
ncbi:PhzF family phenazine biosynthesis isomerase [Streptomyces gamaensis]|uniref:PhzF family phenazine biosynthesis isomerase n=1 Tax=Streptomyces gamaensis TaxID=1763542 RepID=A0ABW0Z3J9_9ACTN